MSELINNSAKRKENLKEVILRIHNGESPELLNKQLAELLEKIPYGEVVEVEQELISEGLPMEEVQKFCDVHSRVLNGNIDLSHQKIALPGHPVDTFIKENKEIEKVIKNIEKNSKKILKLEDNSEFGKLFFSIKSDLNLLMDIDKHYLRKENLLFPFLEKNGITGPPKVMWGKDDEIRVLIKSSISVLHNIDEISTDELSGIFSLIINPAIAGLRDMIVKEEQILFPMSMDKLTTSEWYEIYKETSEYGYCIYDPQIEWKPEGIETIENDSIDSDNINLQSGSFTIKELSAILNTIPFDITFVDKNDKVKFFTQGAERVFLRTRAILKRDVRMCHPPSSVHIVDQIVDDFRSGRETRAPFWIEMHGKFIHIEYFALKDENGEYLGTIEVSKDITELRSLSGEQRLLNYKNEGNNEQ
jgi:DUF438 domain-containing protein